MELFRDGPAPAGAPSDLNSNSIYFEGSVGGNLFTYKADDNTEIEVGGDNGITPDASSNLILVIRFAGLFKKIKLSAITNGIVISTNNKVAEANPCPLIDASASDLYTCFRKGLETTANFGIDSGGHDLNETDNKVR